MNESCMVLLAFLPTQGVITASANRDRPARLGMSTRSMCEYDRRNEKVSTFVSMNKMQLSTSLLTEMRSSQTPLTLSVHHVPRAKCPFTHSNAQYSSSEAPTASGHSVSSMNGSLNRMLGQKHQQENKE